MSGELNRRIARGAAWMVLLRMLSTAVGFMSTIVLARILVPADFGLIAMGTSLAAALEILTGFRLEVALIQNRSATRTHYDTAWTLNLLLTTALAVMLVALAGTAAGFYDEPRLENVIYVLALGCVVDGFQNIGIVNFQKELDFSREFTFMFLRRIVGTAVTIAAALALRSYWALVLGILAGRVAGMVISYLMHPYRPRLSLAVAGELARFSGWLVLDNLIFVLRHRSAEFLIGKLSGGRQLGIFVLSADIAGLVTANLAAPVSRALLPGYAQMAADMEQLRRGYLAVIGLMALVALPAAAGISATAPLFVPLLLGPRWLDTIGPIQILAVGSTLSLLLSGTNAAYLAAGLPRLLATLSGIYVIVLVPTLYVLTPRYGATGAAWSFVVAAVVNLPVQFVVSRRALGVPFAAQLASLWRPVIACIVMYLVVRGVISALPGAATPVDEFLQLLAGVGGGIVAYTGALLLLWQLAGRPSGAERIVFDQFLRSRRTV